MTISKNPVPISAPALYMRASLCRDNRPRKIALGATPELDQTEWKLKTLNAKIQTDICT
jgi:hypothetical protein